MSGEWIKIGARPLSETNPSDPTPDWMRTMTTIDDLLKAQATTDVLITRAFMAEAGYTLGKKFHPTDDQLTLLLRWQTDSNQRLEALVERMETKNAERKEGHETDPGHGWCDDRADPGIRIQSGT